MKHFSIIIPTLNEADNIQPLLQQISEVTQPHGMEPEIIFVDDGSTDQTRQRIEEYSGELSVRLIPRDTERGLASAVVAGAKAASNEFVMVMDADLSHPPATILALLEPLEQKTHDMVIGSKLHLQNSKEENPVEETIGSHLFGRNSLMYSYWLPAAQAADRHILVISQEKAKIHPASFSNHYRNLGKIHEINIKKQGKDAGLYYYRLLTGYTPEKKAGQLSHSHAGQSGNGQQGDTIIADTTPAINESCIAL